MRRTAQIQVVATVLGVGLGFLWSSYSQSAIQEVRSTVHINSKSTMPRSFSRSSRNTALNAMPPRSKGSLDLNDSHRSIMSAISSLSGR